MIVLLECTEQTQNRWSKRGLSICSQSGRLTDSVALPSQLPVSIGSSSWGVASVERFRRLCAERGIETPLNVQLPAVIEPTLFDISLN